MANYQSLEFKNKDYLFKGLKWEIKNPNAYVVIMEGMEEHTRRYDCFAKFLNDHGFSVYSLDPFGQGENVRDHLENVGIWPVDGFAIFVEVVHELIAELKKNNKPVYIFSHSMGSFMGHEYMLRYPGDVKKVVLCGFGGKNPAVGFGYALAKLITTKKKRNQKAKLLDKLMFGNFNCGIKNPKTKYDWLSYDEENVQKYIADPLCGFGPNNGFCLEFCKFMKDLFIKKRLMGMDKNQEIFIITGKEDPVTNFSEATTQSEKIYHKYGIDKVDIKIYEGMRHEILQEKDKMIVYQDVLNFFTK